MTADVIAMVAKKWCHLETSFQWEASVNIPDGSSTTDLKSQGSAGVHSASPSIIPSTKAICGACQFMRQ